MSATSAAVEDERHGHHGKTGPALHARRNRGGVQRGTQAHPDRGEGFFSGRCLTLRSLNRLKEIRVPPARVMRSFRFIGRQRST